MNMTWVWLSSTDVSDLMSCALSCFFLLIRSAFLQPKKASRLAPAGGVTEIKSPFDQTSRPTRAMKVLKGLYTCNRRKMAKWNKTFICWTAGQFLSPLHCGTQKSKNADSPCWQNWQFQRSFFSVQSGFYSSSQTETKKKVLCVVIIVFFYTVMKLVLCI